MPKGCITWQAALDILVTMVGFNGAGLGNETSLVFFTSTPHTQTVQAHSALFTIQQRLTHTHAHTQNHTLYPINNTTAMTWILVILATMIYLDPSTTLFAQALCFWISQLKGKTCFICQS